MNHGALTEHSVSPPIGNGKGREGKGSKWSFIYLNSLVGDPSGGNE